MIAKAQLKQEIYHQIGCDADDWLESARKTSHGFEGAKLAFREQAKTVQQNVLVVKKDLDAGKLEGLEPAEVADYAILQIQRAVDSLQTASLHFENKWKSATGEIAAYTFVVKQLQERYRKEGDKIQRVLDAVESGDVVVDDDGNLSQSEESGGGNGRIPGVRPGMSIAAQRKAEEKASAAALAEAADDSSEAAETSESPKTKPKKKRRKRKTKTAEETVAAPVETSVEVSGGEDSG